MKWTEDQLKVIEHRDGNLLVSAAAGSGKTAVLVERIVSMVNDPIRPIDVDRLLVVTFTKAAAQEMRSRLYDAIIKLVEKNPGNEHLKRQLTYIRDAHICTIDSFCGYVVRNHFDKIDLDPAFRLGDESEMKLLLSDVMDQLLELKYEEASPEFLSVSEQFATNRDDQKLTEVIMTLYRYSQSAVSPEKWMEDRLSDYEISTPTEFDQSGWGRQLVDRANRTLAFLKRSYEQMIALSNAIDGPMKYLPILEKEQEYLLNANIIRTYADIQRVFGAFPSDRLTSAKQDCDPEVKEMVKALRNSAKGRVKEMKDLAAPSYEELITSVQLMRGHVTMLISLVKEFSCLLKQEKRRKNIADFSDIAHYALEILIKDGERTEVAREMADQFEEILIDEYQDSNDIQEALLTAVSKESAGKPNRFMVGDMKQSIYKFRMARPELFMEKYDSYQDVGTYRKLGLHANFRSRSCVTDSVNHVFRSIMHREVGGVEYDRDAELVAGASYPETEKKHAATTQMMLVDLSELNGSTNPALQKSTIDSTQWEAMMIAEKIRELMDSQDPLYVFDRDIGYRKIRYDDIVVLMRSTKDADVVFREVFDQFGIPALTESKEGFFDTWEVRLSLNLLAVIDNPIQDIPLAAVMSSPLFKFSADELTEIRRKRSESTCLYDALQHYEGGLLEKIQAFTEKIASYRAYSEERSISLLLREILRDSGLYLMAGTMQGGVRRRKNLDVLVSKAEAFEKTIYHGIFHFLRYAEKQRELSADGGEAALDHENSVRIMTIHKSKGLEFPVVFVARCEKTFRNETDPILLQQDLGIGIDIIDEKKRIKKKTLVKGIIRDKLREESIGEELRLLYVAMTRAREQLYLCAYYKGEQKRKFDVSDVNSYLDMLFMTEDVPSIIERRDYLPSDILERAVVQELSEKISADLFLQNWENSGQEDSEVRKSLQEVLSYSYGSELSDMYVSRSVSALKELLQPESEGGTVPVVNDRLFEKEATRPGFMKESRKKLTGSEKGTLYHRIMEKVMPGAEASTELLRLYHADLISEVEKDTIDVQKINAFWSSELGKRFIGAYQNGNAYREEQFIIGVPASFLYPNMASSRIDKELIMVQGVIDMFFEEEDGLVLVDYKTDYARSEEELSNRYRIQLELYERALIQATGKSVKEKWIYSFALDREILL